MEKHEVNYAERIQTFMAMAEIDNQDIALNYLQRTNWDETVWHYLYIFITQYQCSKQLIYI